MNTGVKVRTGSPIPPLQNQIICNSFPAALKRIQVPSASASPVHLWDMSPLQVCSRSLIFFKHSVISSPFLAKVSQIPDPIFFSFNYRFIYTLHPNAPLISRCQLSTCFSFATVASTKHLHFQALLGITFKTIKALYLWSALLEKK